MTDSPERAEQYSVRVRRSPKVPVFVVLGIVLGAVAAIIVTAVTPPDAHYSTPQVLGYSALVLAPIGAALGGAIAVALDRISIRRARTLTAERIAAAPRVAPSPAESTASADPGSAPPS